MRYVFKGNEPRYMLEWKSTRLSCGQSILYKEFDKKQELNHDLRIEQHSICCYCQCVIDHYHTEGGNPDTAAHNEHLYPQNVPEDTCSQQLQMDYKNIFACCIGPHRQKRQKHLIHCGEAKENKIIPNLICREDCASFFFYSLSGEIIPIQQRKIRWEEYKNIPCEQLTKEENDALVCIKVLNLNCVSLVEERKNCIDSLLKMYDSKSHQELLEIREKLISSINYPSYLELRLQFLNRLIESRK